MKIYAEQFVESLDKQGRLELFKALIEYYGCVTVKFGKEEGDIGANDVKLDKTANECLVIKVQ